MKRRPKLGYVVNDNVVEIIVYDSDGPRPAGCNDWKMMGAILEGERVLQMEKLRQGESMNLIAKKILEHGGTIITEPLTNEDGSLNKKCTDELLAVLEEPRGLAGIAQAAADRLLKGASVPDKQVAGIIEAACSVCVASFAGAILHGDEVHRLWLLEAANAFVQGEPMPPPRAKTPISNP